ncbi:MAG: arsenic metallochaperone ArsD family protein, partial [Planctomycetales bacterium]|nr:arsenic metallochaperone ArsD family protein [Planctomycetales bacterium]
LPRFAGDLDWLKSQGHEVQRFNLAQEAAAFAKNPTVQQVLEERGVECLPLVIVDGEVVSQGDYPTRAHLAQWTKTKMQSTNSLPIVEGGDCCGESGCC